MALKKPAVRLLKRKGEKMMTLSEIIEDIHGLEAELAQALLPMPTTIPADV